MREIAVKALRQIEASALGRIWDAHRGCGLIAGALLVQEDLITDEAKASVRRLLVRTLASQQDSRLESFERRRSLTREQFSTSLRAALLPDARVPREIGHDVIYSAYVMKALDRFGITPWESLLDRVRLLIDKIKASGPGWITVNGKNEIRELDAEGMRAEGDCWATFSGFDRPRPMEVGDMQLGHLLTHAHAIEMSRIWANQELVADFDLAYRKRLTGLWLANGDQRDKSSLPRRKLDPRAKGYWALVETLGDMHGHAFKYAYSFLELRRARVSPADLEAFSRIVWPDIPRL
jgi:hypothetical protein